MPRAAQARPHGLARPAHLSRDLGSQPATYVRVEDPPLAGRGCTRHEAGAAFQGASRVDPVLENDLAGAMLEARGFPARSPPARAEASRHLVTGDAEQPGLEARTPFEAIQAAHRLEEDVLADVLRLVDVAQPP